VSAVEVVALTGGIGGAKLALGLYRVLPPGALACVVNTGDDFVHLGLHVSPDLDTTLYTLAGCDNPEQGWGRRDETWTFMRVLEELGGESWFRLGDGDLALHVERTRRLARGERLGTVMDDVRQRLAITARLLPMSDDPVRTRVLTRDAELAFQEYFVKLRAEPEVRAITFAGAVQARPGAGLADALASSQLRAIVICPSNPYLSIDPILAIPGLPAALRARGVPVVAVSPLIGGRAVKGPTAKIMRELGIETSNRAIATHYGELLDGLVIDEADGLEALPSGGPSIQVTRTLMQTLKDRERLARSTLEFADRLRRGG
jgi:LPPG:FO 2-phospho-L-lactate transferase